MTLDPTQYTVFPSVFVVDEFKMTDDTGGLVTILDDRFIDRLCARMNERESTTGDLCPIVVGHTVGGIPEVDEPQVVGFVRGWRKEPFFATGRTGARTEFWIKNQNTFVINGETVTLDANEVAARWPRRSSEVWTSRYEIDPVSLLGATTPARDLGLLKLSRSGSLTYTCPGETDVPLPTQSPPLTAGVTPVDAAAAGQSAPMEKMQATLDQLLAMITKMVTPEEPAAAPGAEGAAPGAEGAPGELSDAELEQLLGAGGEGEPAGADAGVPPDASRKGEKPVQNNAVGYPGGTNTHVNEPMAKLSRENSEIKLKLARLEIERDLVKIKDAGFDVNADDAELIADLAAMPEDMRKRGIERIKKLARPSPTKDSFNLESAIQKSTDGTKKRVPSNEENQRVIKLARDKGISYEDAVVEAGYSL